MPRTQRNPDREDEGRAHDELEGDGAPRIDDVEPDDDRAEVRLYDEDTTIDIEEDDIAHEIDIEDLVAMEGPDA